MVGWDNEDESFVFELTFNYGVSSYERGNDLKSIIMHRYFNSKDLKQIVKEHGGLEKDEVWYVQDFVFSFVESEGRGIIGVDLNVTNLEESD